MPSRGVYRYCKNPSHATITLNGGINKNTAKTLDIFTASKVKASFFISGKTISKYADLGDTLINDHYEENIGVLRHIVRRGNYSGSQGFRNLDLTGLTPEEVALELDTTDKFFRNSIGVRPRLFRAPDGYCSLNYILFYFLLGNFLADCLINYRREVISFSIGATTLKT